MKIGISILLTLIHVVVYSQVSDRHWIAGGCNNQHHNENVDRAIKCIYGDPMREKSFVSIPDFISSWDFDIYTSDKDRGNYLFHKKISKTEPGVFKFVVYSKKDAEYEYVTVANGFVIVYQYKKQQMIIYKI